MTEPGQESKAPDVQSGSNPELGLRLHRFSLHETATGLSNGAFEMKKMGDTEAADEASELWPFLEDIATLFYEGTNESIWREYHKLSVSDIVRAVASTPYEREVQQQLDQLKATLRAAFEHDLKAHTDFINTFLASHPGLIEVRPDTALVSVGYELHEEVRADRVAPVVQHMLLSDGTILKDEEIPASQPKVLFEKLPDSCQKTLRTFWDLYEGVHLV